MLARQSIRCRGANAWEEVEKGIRIEDFRLDNMRERIAQVGDLWKPMLQARGRFKLDRVA